jgi:hypothetical protein
MWADLAAGLNRCLERIEYGAGEAGGLNWPHPPLQLLTQHRLEQQKTGLKKGFALFQLKYRVLKVGTKNGFRYIQQNQESNKYGNFMQLLSSFGTQNTVHLCLKAAAEPADKDIKIIPVNKKWRGLFTEMWILIDFNQEPAL